MSHIDQSRLAEVQGRSLKRGAHPTQDAMCVMEAVAYVAGEPWSDHPICASPTIAGFLRSWNDTLPDDETRTRLLAPLIPRLVGSRGDDELELRRSYLALDWMVRVMTPAWLELAGLTEHAALLRELVELTDPPSCEAATATVRAARAAAWDAARAAAWSAATEAAAWAAAEAAAWSAATGAAAWSAATEAAAWDAARAAAWSAATGAAAWDAVWDAAWAAAWAAAEDAAWAAATGAAAWAAAEDAAEDAAGAALAPTVERLQASALDLIDRMLEIGGAS